MTAQILPFPAKSKPRLVVPTTDVVVRLWAQKEAARVAWKMNSCAHNLRAWQKAEGRYLRAMENQLA